MRTNFFAVFFILLFSMLDSYGQCPPVDTLPPTIFPPPDLVLSNDIGLCTSTISASTLSYPVYFDICGVNSVLPSFPTAANYTFPVGVTVVTWTATDTSGNSSSVSQTVTVIDDENPQIACSDNITINTTPGGCEAFVNIPLAIASDNCALNSLTNNYTSGGADASAIYPVGLTEVTFIATDSANNTSSCTVNITVINSQLPEITLIGPSSITLEACDTYQEEGATALDSCLGDLTSDISIDTSDLDLNNVGSYDVIYNVTNSAGVSATPIIRTINVVDTTSPSLTLIGPNPLNIGDCATYVELGAEAIDPCFGDISANVVVDNSTVNSGVLGSYTVTYNVMDNSNNTTSQITRVVNVIEVTAPIISLIGENPQTIEVCSAYTELGATATDPCFNTDYTDDIVIDTSAVDTSVVGTYMVTYNVTDIYGNAAIELTRTVEVVDTTPPSFSLIGDNPQIVDACTSYTELGATAIDCSGTDYTDDIIIDTSNINTDVEGVYQVTYTVCDSYGNCTGNLTRDVEVVLSNPSANAGSDVTNSVCTDTTINLDANPIIGNSASGLWTVTSGQTSRFSFSDPSSPTSTFTGDVGEQYTLTWTIDNPSPCVDVSDSISVNFVKCSTIDFDGINDNITFRDNYNLNSNFTLEVWVKSETQNNSIQTIFSKRETNNLIDGYDLRVVDNYVSFNWNNGESLVAPYQINTNQWHHIAVTFSSGTYTLYIDGIEMNSTTGTLPISNASYCIAGAMDQNTSPPYKPKNYFDGGMDELRIWNVALTTGQIRKMMNQEVQEDNGSIVGSVISKPISDLVWSDLLGYYRMNQSSDLSNGDLIANNGSSINGLLRYMTSIQEETAPLPHQTISDGNWSDTNSWLNGTVQAIPNSIGIDGTTSIDWNIVKSLHHISSGDKNITLLGLKIISNRLAIENTNAIDGQSLRITDYLYIDGTLDLVGESQLLQDMGSVVDSNGTGELQRDQQGTTNQYNYNYWCAPVSTNGINYSLNNVFSNGLDPDSPASIQWINDYNTAGSENPISLSNKWIYTYENYPLDSYADWSYKGETGLIDIGLGFTLKGSGTIAPPLVGEQNYVFTGTPNNGRISIPITADYQALVGNPYPSAIDANEFILDNTSSIQGALYFWEHFETNATHVLEDYEGGYSIYNLTGGAPAVTPTGISDNGTGVKIPERFVPVAQGFFVEANTMGGEVVFNNNQRYFVKESVTGNANNGSVFFKQTNSSSNNNEVVKRVRISFKSPEGAIRHLLLGFVPNNLAADGYDYGYDAVNTDDFPDDMTWIIEDEQYIIQGVGEFDETKKYPLGIFLNSSGNIEIVLEELENFESEIDVFVYDALLDTYFNIYEQNDYEIFLESDDYLNRFYIAFKDESTLSENFNTISHPVIQYLNKTNEIFINAPNPIDVKDVHLLNVIGQRIKSWSLKNNEFSNEIKIPVNSISEGVYIVKVETNTGTYSKKMIFKIKND